jgi:hypothetical protein
MKMKYFLAALLLVSSLGTPAKVQAGTHESSTPPPPPADVQVRGPRGRGAAFERCLHDRPRPKPMRRANVSLWNRVFLINKGHHAYYSCRYSLQWQLCLEKVVTTSEQSGITMTACQVSAQIGIAAWLANGPYHE